MKTTTVKCLFKMHLDIYNVHIFATAHQYIEVIKIQHKVKSYLIKLSQVVKMTNFAHVLSY